MFSLRRALQLVLIIGLIYASISLSGIALTQVLELLRSLSAKALVLIFIAFTLNFYLSAARLQNSYAQFNFKFGFKSIKQAIFASQLGNVLPIFGALVAQTATMKRKHNISASVSSAIYFYDKVIMALTGMLASITAALLIFRHQDRILTPLTPITNNEALHDARPIEFGFALLLVIFVVYKFALNSADKDKLKSLLTVKRLLAVSKGLMLASVTWLSAAVCFVLCIKGLAGTAGIEMHDLKLCGLSLIVSFISSLPLSVNGWGVREFAAITFFPLALVPKELALAAAISVGIISTLTVLLIAIIESARG